ncbi:GDSL esterase/lipase At3g27950-like isoform X2 [Lotus japonicus]|uniref:GDSL esterase/lipase At3g27950-like isoform X2 n=1 Tax=Lotus japonicus TaxID=34305 RepID=UPI0025897A92|nr:GDSL esterase/lipase At3g27950-like isoform X2 [Lotus japonicus]
MNSRTLIHALWCFALCVACTFIQIPSGNGSYSSSSKCSYPAVYNFGDSNSDTGVVYAAFAGLQSPGGISFFGNLSGRASDGRLIIDFITEELEIPYLSAYLNSIGSNYRHGANFAAGGASIRPVYGFSPFYLGMQVAQFIQLQSHIENLLNQFSSNRTEPPFKSYLPRPEDFSKALYTIDIGQNDLGFGLMHTSEEEVLRSIPEMMRNFTYDVQVLYDVGARVFWIHNTGPIGCLPTSSIFYEPKKGNLDANGCVIPHNKIAQEFNRQLKDQVFQLRRNLPKAKFTYVDVYTAKYELISNASKQGFVNPLEVCCGSYYGYRIDCGKKAVVNGTVYGNPCKNPSQHISWDGVHYTQAANKWVAKHIRDGSLSDPPVPIGQACL